MSIRPKIALLCLTSTIWSAIQLMGQLGGANPVDTTDGATAKTPPGWSFQESFDKNVLSPIYPGTVVYDARPRHLRVHTPTIEVGKDNSLIIAIRDFPLMDSGVPGDMDAVNAIHFLASFDGGKSWTPPWRFDVGYAINPAFIRTKTDDLWMFYNAKNSDIQDDNSVWFCKSTDNFKTWTKPQPIEVGYRVHLIAHNGIQLANGDLLLAFDYDRGNNSKEPFAYSKMDRAAAGLLSSDNGKTWQRYGEIEVPNYSGIPNVKGWPVEQVPVQTTDGRIIMFLRTRSGRIYQSVSRNNGLEWGDAEKLPLSNNDSKVACISLPNGHLVLIWNNCELLDTDKRSPLMASVSIDGGRTWAYTVTLSDDGVNAQYPALTWLDGRLKIIYGYNWDTLKMMDLLESDLHYSWTAINNRGLWSVADGQLRAGKGSPPKNKGDWVQWSKAVSFVTGKPNQFSMEVDVRFDGNISTDAAIGVFSSYQDEDNWTALVWGGDGKLTFQKQQHSGWTNRDPRFFRGSEKKWATNATPHSGKWYRVKIIQRDTFTEMHVFDRETNSEVYHKSIETTYDGHFIALGTRNCAASFDNLQVREIGH